MGVEEDADAGQGLQFDRDYRGRVVVEVVREIRSAGEGDNLEADGLFALGAFPSEPTQALKREREKILTLSEGESVRRDSHLSYFWAVFSGLARPAVQTGGILALVLVVLASRVGRVDLSRERGHVPVFVVAERAFRGPRADAQRPIESGPVAVVVIQYRIESRGGGGGGGGLEGVG